MSEFELKRIHKDSMPAALKKAEHYRLLNEPREAESICRDILEVEPDHKQALITLILALTDQFGTETVRRSDQARALVERRYDALAQISTSPVVELNRAVAIAMTFESHAGLEIIDQLLDDPVLKPYHLQPRVRGDVLAKLGRFIETQNEFEQAAALTKRHARTRSSAGARRALPISRL